MSKNNLPEIQGPEPQFTWAPNNYFWSGYPGESAKGMEFLRAVTAVMPYGFADYANDMPDRVDIRLDEKFTQSWLRVENQGNQGSCQGHGLSECPEYNYGVITGEIVQLSRGYAYYMSQYFDGIRGDRGSTLSGGTKVLEAGLPLESEYPYPSSYKGYGDIPQSAIAAAKAGPFKMYKTVRFKNADEYRAFIGSYLGIVQTGTKWTEQMANIPGHGVFQGVGGRNYGGHSYNLCGYIPVDELGAEARRFVRTRGKYVALVKNSHGTRWGDNGFGYLTDELFDELNRGDLLLGRTDMGDDLKPRPSKRDFSTYRDSRFRRTD